MKKFIAAATSAIFLSMTLLQGAVWAAFSDVSDTNPYKEAINTLSTLSVIDGYDDGTFKPDGAITRAEFTKLIVYMLGFQDLKYSSHSFTDVPDAHWAIDFIQTAYDRGIIAGFGDGIFKPDDPVTYAQALKMVVCTLGYEEFANELNLATTGWADKYIQEAGLLGLTKGISGADFYENATRGMIAQVLDNALEIEMYENNGYKWNKTEKTLLNDYLKVKELKGTVVGIEDNVMEDCSYKLLEDQMDIMDSSGNEHLIDYSSYKDGKSELSKYLGSTLKIYYRQLSSNDEMTLISVNVESTKNSVTEISYDDLNSLSGNTLKYYDSSSKTKNVKLRADDLTVRYNDKLVPSSESVEIDGVTYSRQDALEQWLNSDSSNLIYGSVVLTDNADDGTIDMIQIYDYDTMVAYSNPSSSDYRITDKLVTGNYLILDPQSADYTYTITRIDKDGNKTDIPITSIMSNDIILYAKSLDGEHYTLLVSNNPITGTISSLSSDKKKLTMSGTTYDIGPKCESYILEKNNKELKTGAKGTFYLDAFGTIVYGTLDETSAAPYGYITNAYTDYDEGGKPSITVFAPNINASQAVSYHLKNNVKLNGSSVKAEAALSRIQAAAGYADDESEYADKIYGAGKTPSNTTYAQPARVTVSGGEVSEIVLLRTDEVMAQNEDTEQIVKCKELGQYTYATNSFTQNGKSSFSINSSTVILYVPSDRSEKNRYAKKTISQAFTSGDQYWLEAYDINSSKIAGLIILYGNDGTLTTVKKDSDFSVVASLPESVYNEAKDDSVQQFEVFTGASNTARTWSTYDDEEFSDVEVGDVIQFAYDSDNLIQGRINNIKFKDIAAVLDGEKNNGELYNWEEEQTPSEENNNQRFKFDYRFKRPGTTEDEVYTSSSIGTVPNSRAAVFNISQVLTDEKKIYVTKSGFTENEDGVMTLDDENYEELTISTSTRILRMEDDRDEISRYVADTTTDLTINDLRDAKNYGVDCSKILALISKGNVKMILIYK